MLVGCRWQGCRKGKALIRRCENVQRVGQGIDLCASDERVGEVGEKWGVGRVSCVSSVECITPKVRRDGKGMYDGLAAQSYQRRASWPASHHTSTLHQHDLSTCVLTMSLSSLLCPAAAAHLLSVTFHLCFTALLSHSSVCRHAVVLLSSSQLASSSPASHHTAIFEARHVLSLVRLLICSSSCPWPAHRPWP